MEWAEALGHGSCQWIPKIHGPGARWGPLAPGAEGGKSQITVWAWGWQGSQPRHSQAPSEGCVPGVKGHTGLQGRGAPESGFTVSPSWAGKEEALQVRAQETPACSQGLGMHARAGSTFSATPCVG